MLKIFVRAKFAGPASIRELPSRMRRDDCSLGRETIKRDLFKTVLKAAITTLDIT
jgi:hypothetical protein